MQILTLLLALTAQDPGRSTPEKALGAYLEFEKKREAEDREWSGKTYADIMALGDPIRTDDQKKRAAKKAAAFRDFKLVEQTKTRTIRTGAKETGGRITLVVDEKIVSTVRRPGEPPVEMDSSCFHEYDLEKSGETWYLTAFRRGCLVCKSLDKCSNCGGSGKEEGEPCFLCEGKGDCKLCPGKGLEDGPLFKIPQGLFVSGAGFKPARDGSTAKSAAQAVADLWFEESVEMTAKTLSRLKERHKLDRTFLHPRLVDKAAADLQREEERGAARFKSERPKIESIDEKGDAATVTVTWPPRGIRSEAVRFVLKKTGAGWRVDAEQSRCGSCAGNGKCLLCKGAATLEGGPCYACEESGRCPMCKGEGWKE